MVPKKPKEIINIVSEETDIPFSVIDDIVSFYYKEVRKNLTNLSDLKINIPGLGDFLIKTSGVRQSIKRFEKANKTVDYSSFTGYHRKRDIVARLEKLHAINKKIEVFLEEKKEFKLKRYEQINKDLEEQKTDTGGDN
jgi:nucleoid DNA-binding protein